MADIPPEAIQAAAEAIERKLLTEPPEGCMTWMDADEELARAALEAGAPAIRAAQEKAIAAAVAAERERIVTRIGVKMHRQPHAHAGFADGWETAVSYAQEVARNPDCEVAPLADLVRQMRLKAGEPSSSPRDYFEDGRTAERESIRQLAIRNQATCTSDEGTGCYFADLLEPAP